MHHISVFIISNSSRLTEVIDNINWLLYTKQQPIQKLFMEIVIAKRIVTITLAGSVVFCSLAFCKIISGTKCAPHISLELENNQLVRSAIGRKRKYLYDMSNQVQSRLVCFERSKNYIMQWTNSLFAPKFIGIQMSAIPSRLPVKCVFVVGSRSAVDSFFPTHWPRAHLLLQRACTLAPFIYFSFPLFVLWLIQPMTLLH